MFNSILVVCVGNICRSPTGERLLRKYLPHKNIASAGVNALSGYEADAAAINAANEHQLSLDSHCAQQLTKEMCQQYDLILVMERGHIEAVCNISPSVRGKTMLFGHWTAQEIADPYKKSHEAFQSVYRQLDEAAKAWANKLN
ncbi:protein tyrosine phosphatase [Winslowiella sp. 2C04]|uniref:arsenate reductase/protein-tyrosine-phosphatase family protein n=1 Tax=Winslowiella sp. 2C04 TaxID=3416179 RepID=UPI003CF8201C